MTKHAVEARVHRRLDNAGGVYVTFQIHADDTNAVDGVRVGNTVVLAWEDVASTNVEKIEVAVDPRAAKGEDAKASPRERPKRKFDELSAPEQAGILSNDLEFQLYVSTRFASSTALDTAEFIREHCGVPSRSQLTSENVAWKNLIRDFRAWHTDQRYAESIHR